LNDPAPTNLPSQNLVLGFFGWDETQLNLGIRFWVHNFYFFSHTLTFNDYFFFLFPPLPIYHQPLGFPRLPFSPVLFLFIFFFFETFLIYSSLVFLFMSLFLFYFLFCVPLFEVFVISLFFLFSFFILCFYLKFLWSLYSLVLIFFGLRFWSCGRKGQEQQEKQERQRGRAT
jgi:hypothetical protein